MVGAYGKVLMVIVIVFIIGLVLLHYSYFILRFLFSRMFIVIHLVQSLLFSFSCLF